MGSHQKSDGRENRANPVLTFLHKDASSARELMVIGYRAGAITDAKRRPASIPVIIAFGLMPDGGGCSLTAPDNLARGSGFQSTR